MVLRVDLGLSFGHLLTSRFLRNELSERVERAHDRHVVKEELHPLVPVSRINVLRIVPLLVVESLVSNVDNLVKQPSAKLGVVLGLGGLLVRRHLRAAHNALLDDSLRRLLHGDEHFLLLEFG